MRMKERGLSTGALVGIVVGVVVAVVVPVTIVAVLLTGGGVDLTTPEATITSAFNAGNAYDADTVYSTFSAKLKSEIPIDILRAQAQQAKAVNAKLTGLQISNVTISDDTATATASLTVSSPGATYSTQATGTVLLAREGGLWKIDNVINYSLQTF